MEIIKIRCCKNCLSQMKKDFTISEIENICVDNDEFCPVCKKRIKEGFSVEIFAEDLNTSVETIYCCGPDCLQSFIADFGSSSLRILLLKEREGQCVVCGKKLSKTSFELVISEPK